MKANKRKHIRGWKQGGILLAAGLLAGNRLVASSVLMGSPTVSPATLSAQEDAANSVMNVFLPSAWNSGGSAALLQYGTIILHPHASYGLSYGTGISSSPGAGQDTFIQMFSPGLTVDLGQHWALDYTAGLTFYSDQQLHNTVSHSASLSWNTAYEDWIFGFSQGISYSDTPITETAAQTSQQGYSTALTTGYAINSKLSVNVGVSQNLNLVSGLQNSYNWATTEALNYQLWPRLNAGISAGAGYTKLSDNSASGVNNPDILNEQLQGLLNWRATDKLSLSLSAGLESQQFMAPGYADSLNPIFSAAVQYQPFAVTQISLNAARSVGASDYYIIAQSTETTTVGLNLNQRLLEKYHLGLGISYAMTDYTSTLSVPGYSASTKRSDNGYTFSASLGRSFFSHGNWSVNYQYGDNQSSAAGYSQQSSQIGFQVGFYY